MIEIEVKVSACHRPVRDALEHMGARFIGTEKQADTYYKAPHRDFSKTDEALRIRCVDGVSVMTYKGKKLDTVSKTREEFETPVEGDAASSILLALGFKRSGHVSKSRDIYSYNDLIICLDTVDGLGEFVEVELMADIVAGSDISSFREHIFNTLAKLGIHAKESIRSSYLEMVLEKEKAR